MKQKNLKEDHIMIKEFIAKPHQVLFQSEKSLEKKIENNKEIIEFLEYQSKTEFVDLDYCESRIEELKDEIGYYKEIIRLKNNSDYIHGLLGGEIVIMGAFLAGILLKNGINKLRK